MSRIWTISCGTTVVGEGVSVSVGLGRAGRGVIVRVGEGLGVTDTVGVGSSVKTWVVGKGVVVAVTVLAKGEAFSGPKRVIVALATTVGP